MNPPVIHSDYRVQVLDRTFAILGTLAESSELLGPTEIGKRLNLNKSTVHRILNVVERHRYVERDVESSKYRLGLRLAELGSQAFPRLDLEGAKTYSNQLASHTPDAVGLAEKRLLNSRIRDTPSQTAGQNATHPNVLHSDYRVQVLDRTFALLSAIAESDQLLSSSELGKRLNLNKSTVHRLLNVLAHHRYVERDCEGSKYRLGLKLAELGSFALPRADLLDAAKPFVKELASHTGEAAHLGILDGNEILSVLHASSDNNNQAASTVGRRSPFHCTSLGKAILAFRGDADKLIQLHRFAPYSKNTIRSSVTFQMELHKVRQRGIATDNEEFEPGLRCIGAPVRDMSGSVIAALSIAGPLSRVTVDRSRELAQRVICAAAGLSERVKSKS